VKEWWGSYFDETYLLEYEPLFDLTRDRAEVARLIEVLELPVGARILDCPCGQGRHAHLLAEAGFDVDGLDYSKELLAHAKRRGTGPNLRYTRGNMRDLPKKWNGKFDAVVNLFTSFGFFVDPKDDERVIRSFARVLKPGGVLVWHGASRDGVAARFVSKDWWRTKNGTTVTQHRRFDPLAGVLTVDSAWDGPGGKGERSHRIRLYTATRLAEMCRNAGLVVERAFDNWEARQMRRTSSEMLLVARLR
jgi:ubiquinone/menaquinone biosynthesis C-methylase UbiE